MTSSNFSNHTLSSSELKGIQRIRLATLLLLSFVVISGVVVVAWFAGVGAINQIFAQIQLMQENPPMWLKVPMVMGEYLLAPTVVLFLIALFVMKVSPQPRTWSRVLVVCILLGLTIRYILWRSLSTLNVADPLNGVFSLGLFALEMLLLINTTLQLFLLLRVKNRRREADILSLPVLDGTYQPSVDILIPTYDEPVFILERTIIGCQALEYNNKKIYLLDDTRRLEMKQLASDLGCEYITRADNRYAKAGNLNNALPKTNGELIVIFDADFVPTKNFLHRTVGFFQDEQIALVQTPQSFYNIDPIARNLGLENVLTPEEEVFYRQIQPLRDAAGSVICSGTSFVVRRSALDAVGGFVTDSISEDYFTGIRISALGYRLVYLDEKLSAGLAADNITAHAIQRLRWGRGTLQAFFIKSNPLTIPGLRLIQRLAHLEGLLHWCSSISRGGFLLMPLAYSFLSVNPIRATPLELIYFFLPYYVVQLTVFSWLNQRSRSALLSDIYTLVLTLPLALTVIQVMLNPFSQGFKVTPKGTRSDRFYFNTSLAIPLIIVFIVTAVSFWRNLGMSMMMGAMGSTMTPEIAQQIKGINLGWIWGAYNLLTIGISLLILVDVPKPDVYEWFNLRRLVKLDVAGKTLWGVTTSISQVGAEVALTQAMGNISTADTPITLLILEEGLVLSGQITQTGFKGEFPTMQIMFEQIALPQQRRLVEMLFCRPGQWIRQNAPSELQSLWLLLRILLKPRVLFERNLNSSVIARAIAVSQV
ncbi:glycosyltransferase family 2 protein [Iningainema tapete]|uniref:Glycosyltransferase n=1 Tax=Iningainema tapete BLCC-T55 TaxID=2748662 RepID=A0A8J6XEM5_9CYAN|nr:cellulose synthase catalytic subunit [Iningainema tapete]MBD2771026.1 glycosyltransferase [Iningainema tapete BLCC-T55]